MLTTGVYDIQLKNRKTPQAVGGSSITEFSYMSQWLATSYVVCLKYY